MLSKQVIFFFFTRIHTSLPQCIAMWNPHAGLCHSKNFFGDKYFHTFPLFSLAQQLLCLKLFGAESLIRESPNYDPCRNKAPTFPCFEDSLQRPFTIFASRSPKQPNNPRSNIHNISSAPDQKCSPHSGGRHHPGRSRKRGQSWELLGSRTAHKSASKCWCIVEWASGIYKVISRTLPVEQRSVGKGVSDLEKNLGVLSLHAARISPNPSPGGCHAMLQVPPPWGNCTLSTSHWCASIFKYKPEKHSTSSFWEMPLKEGTNYPDLLC